MEEINWKGKYNDLRSSFEEYRFDEAKYIKGYYDYLKLQVDYQIQSNQCSKYLQKERIEEINFNKMKEQLKKKTDEVIELKKKVNELNEYLEELNKK